MENAFDADVHYAQIVKVYGSERIEIGATVRSCDLFREENFSGSPDVDPTSTSYVERLNATTACTTIEARQWVRWFFKGGYTVAVRPNGCPRFVHLT